MHTKLIMAIAGWAASCSAQELVLSAPATIQLKVVENSPFSATATTELTQGLADGNRIVHSRTAAIARDSLGRTRREESNAASPVVFIQDPAAGFNYVLESVSRQARKIAVPNADAVGLTGEKKSVGSSTDRVGDAHESNTKSESLGIQIIEGLQVEGTRITRTILAGQAGNERPLDVVLETWYSRDLQTVLMSKSVDPRSGETDYRLTEIHRSEPPYSLFVVPEDYTITEPPPNLRR